MEFQQEDVTIRQAESLSHLDNLFWSSKWREHNMLLQTGGSPRINQLHCYDNPVCWQALVYTAGPGSLLLLCQLLYCTCTCSQPFIRECCWFSEQQWSCWNTNTETLHEITKTARRQCVIGETPWHITHVKSGPVQPVGLLTILRHTALGIWKMQSGGKLCVYDYLEIVSEPLQTCLLWKYPNNFLNRPTIVAILRMSIS